MSVFIFGYGSLICADSRARTAPTGRSHVVRVAGLQREWRRMGEDAKGMSSVAVREDEAASCNGVLFEVDATHLAHFDGRELPHGYRRVPLSLERLELLQDGMLPPHAQYWVYVAEGSRPPTQDAPIVQSYLDVIVDGCLQISQDYALEFVRSTAHWQAPWHDDRHAPVYPRFRASDEHVPRVDALLQHGGLDLRLRQYRQQP